MPLNESEFKKFMENRRSINESTLDNILYSFPNSKSKQKLNCEFFLIESTVSEIREEEFIEFITSKSINYVLQRKEYILEGLTAEEQASKMFDIVKKTKSKFVKNKTTGEAGELILFLILESKSIFQLLNKMNLKSSSQMHVHGLDAIHIQVDNGIILHYGQSKMHKDFSSGVNAAVKDIKNFDHKKEKFEIDLVSSHIDNSRYDEYAEKLVKLLSPYSDKRNLSKTNAVFIGYDESLMGKQKPASESSLRNYLQTEYQKEHDRLFKTVSESIQNNLTDDRNRTTTFYILPFKSVDKFRKKFLEELET